MDKPRIADMKDPVIVWDNSCGLYWKDNSLGYTAAAEMAGIYERASAPRVSERKLEYFKVPEEHVQRVKEDLATARRRVAALEKDTERLKRDLDFASAEVERLTLALAASPDREYFTATATSTAIAAQRQKEGE